jgi:hypothetical protein
MDMDMDVAMAMETWTYIRSMAVGWIGRRCRGSRALAARPISRGKGLSVREPCARGCARGRTQSESPSVAGTYTASHSAVW